MKGHTKEVCYKLVGYPPEYNKFKKKGMSTYLEISINRSNVKDHNVVADIQFINCQGYSRNKANAYKVIKEVSAPDVNGKGVVY